MSQFLKSFAKNESGATAIEYGLIAAGIAPTDRAETVDLERFCALARGFES